MVWARSLLVEYPSTKSLSYFWNVGSILAFVYVIQVVSGLLLVVFYRPSASLAFNSVDYIGREVWGGIFFRIIHLNGASFFFLFLFSHILKALTYRRFYMTHTWNRGTTIFLLVIGTAFLGYVLPWGQISFWGATAITNFISAIPYIGQDVVIWVWGGFNVGGPTLGLFFTLHYLLPLLLAVVILLHLTFLHTTRSTSRVGIHESFSKVKFTPFFSVKDALGAIFILLLYFFAFFSPWTLGDPENWIPANPMSSPVHIQPEWYFLFAYAILRSVPNKLGGVIALVARVIVLYVFPLFVAPNPPNNLTYSVGRVVIFLSFLMLTFLGSCPVEDPFIGWGQFFRITFFVAIFLILLS